MGKTLAFSERYGDLAFLEITFLIVVIVNILLLAFWLWKRNKKGVK